MESEKLRDRGGWSPTINYAPNDYVFLTMENGWRVYYVALENCIGKFDHPTVSKKWKKDEDVRKIRDAMDKFMDLGLPFSGLSDFKKEELDE